MRRRPSSSRRRRSRPRSRAPSRTPRPNTSSVTIVASAAGPVPARMSNDARRLAVSVSSLQFRNPILLAAGTAGYGLELDGVMDLDAIGGIVTKAVSLEPRTGAPEPRVAEFAGGMINAVGLANPGLAEVTRTHVPWLATHHAGTRKLFNVVGFTVDEFASV